MAYKIDKYGIKNWSTWFKILLGLFTLYLYIFIAALPLYWIESVEESTKITSYRDAVWLLQMAASTIGFGDVYPITELGRLIVAVSFYIGVGIAGFIGATIAGALTNFTETGVRNRELREQNSEILKIVKQIQTNQQL